MVKVILIDTSILCELLKIPGKNDLSRRQEHMDELERKAEAGERLVVPVTTLIETGNHIVQSGLDRYKYATDLVEFLFRAFEENSPFLVPTFDFGPDFVTALCEGGSCGQTLAQLAARQIGAGDAAILVQRDQLRAKGYFSAVEVWTLDGDLGDLANST